MSLKNTKFLLKNDKRKTKKYKNALKVFPPKNAKKIP